MSSSHFFKFKKKKSHTFFFSSPFYPKVQQMVNEVQNKEFFEEQSEPATYNDCLETNPIP